MDGTSLIGLLHRLDQDITLLLNNLSSPATDQLWLLMSDKTVWIPAYVLCTYFLFRRLGWKKALVVLCSVGLAFGLCDQFSTIVKHSVDRLRPSYSARMLLGGLNVLEGRGGFCQSYRKPLFIKSECQPCGIQSISDQPIRHISIAESSQRQYIKPLIHRAMRITSHF